MLQLNRSSVSEPVMDTRSAPAQSGDTAGKSSFADVIKDQGKPDDKTVAQGKLSGADAKGKTAVTKSVEATDSQDETAQVADAEPLAVKQSENKKSKADSAKQGDEDMDFLQHLQDSLSADTAIRANPVAPVVTTTAVAVDSDGSKATSEASETEAANSTTGGKKLPPSLNQCLLPEEGTDGAKGEDAQCATATPSTAHKPTALPAELAAKIDQSAQGSAESQGQQAASSQEDSKSPKAIIQSQTPLDSATSSAAGNGVDKGALTSFFPLNHAGEAEKALSPVETTPDETQTTQISSLAKSSASGKTGKTTAFSLQASTDKEGVNATADKSAEGSVSSQGVSKADAAPTATVASTTTPETMTGAISSHAGVQRTVATEQGSVAASDNSHLLSSRASETYKELASVDLGNSSHGAQQLADRVSLMIGQKWHEAELELEPLGLGKMQIQLSIGQDQQASVQFVVQQQHSREAVEQTLPRLKEMLAQQGIQLTQSSVQQQSQQQGQHNSSQQQGLANSGDQGQRGGGRGSQAGENGGETTGSVQNLLIQRSNDTGIDFYA